MTVKYIYDNMKVKPAVHARMKTLARKSETYSDLIHRLIDCYLEANPDWAKVVEKQELSNAAQR